MRRSTANSQTMLNATYIDQDDDFFWDEDDVERGVAIVDDKSSFFSGSRKFGKSQNISRKKNEGGEHQLKTFSQQDVGICWLPLDGSVSAILALLNDFYTEKKIGFSNPTPNEFVGYLFKEASYALFNLMVYIREEDGLPGLRITRLSGDAFLTTEMFVELRNKLLYEDLVSAENDPWSADLEEYFDEEYDFCSESENEEELEIQAPFKYLQLEMDTGLIDYWIHDLLENEYFDQRLNTLMMMAHNSENLKNLELMLSHSDGKLFEGILKVMEEENKNLPTVLSCVRTLHNIISGSENVNVSWDMVKMMCDCLLTWSQNQENKKFSYNRPVTNSTEIQTTLASSLGQLIEKMQGEAPSDLVNSVDEVQYWLDTERDLCHPEARENLELFVEKFDAIACR